MEPTPATRPRQPTDDATLRPRTTTPHTLLRHPHDASTRVNEHDQNVDTLLTRKAGARTKIRELSPTRAACLKRAHDQFHT